MTYYRCHCRHSLAFEHLKMCDTCPECSSGFASSPEYKLSYTPSPHDFVNDLCSHCGRNRGEILANPRPPWVFAQ